MSCEKCRPEIGKMIAVDDVRDPHCSTCGETLRNLECKEDLTDVKEEPVKDLRLILERHLINAHHEPLNTEFMCKKEWIDRAEAEIREWAKSLVPKKYADKFPNTHQMVHNETIDTILRRLDNEG